MVAIKLCVQFNSIGMMFVGMREKENVNLDALRSHQKGTVIKVMPCCSACIRLVLSRVS
jgi:hypothetical protein